MGNVSKAIRFHILATEMTTPTSPLTDRIFVKLKWMADRLSVRFKQFSPLSKASCQHCKIITTIEVFKYSKILSFGNNQQKGKILSRGLLNCISCFSGNIIITKNGWWTVKGSMFMRDKDQVKLILACWCSAIGLKKCILSSESNKCPSIWLQALNLCSNFLPPTRLCGKGKFHPPLARWLSPRVEQP